jgi:ankyrin repeat protein
LIKDLGNLSTLHFAWKKDIAALLIAKGANVNVTFKGGLTPLHVKAMFDSIQAAKEMPKKGMDVKATKEEMVSVAELLIAKGANVNAKDDQGKTPLRLAKEMNFQEMVELLKSKGGKE